MSIKNKNLSSGFTLIELLVVMFIFSVVVLLVSSSLTTGFISGRTSSNSSKDINRDLTSFFETVQSKMVTAKKDTIIGAGTVYGFTIVGTDIIAIRGNTECTFIYYDGTKKAISAKTNSCNAMLVATDFTDTDRITSNNLTISKFLLTNSNPFTAGSTSAPYLTIELTAQDTKTGATADFNNTFILDSLVVKDF